MGKKNGAGNGIEIAKGSEAEYRKYLPLAMAVRKSDVQPLHADASLAHQNISVGVASLLAREKEARKLPDTNVAALKELPDICLAVAFASARVPGTRSTGDIAKKLHRLGELRKKLITAADALVLADLFPAKDVADIHAGKGRLDEASDCVALAFLFRTYAKKIAGKTAVTKAEIAEADALGSELLVTLKPKGAPRTRTEKAQQAADVRDRLWALVRQRYDALWRACAYLYGEADVAKKCPPLLSHAATTSARKKANAAKRAARAPAPSK